MEETGLMKCHELQIWNHLDCIWTG